MLNMVASSRFFCNGEAEQVPEGLKVCTEAIVYGRFRLNAVFLTVQQKRQKQIRIHLSERTTFFNEEGYAFRSSNDTVLPRMACKVVSCAILPSLRMISYLAHQFPLLSNVFHITVTPPEIQRVSCPSPCLSINLPSEVLADQRLPGLSAISGARYHLSTMAFSTFVFAILFALIAGSASAQSPGPAPAASPAQRPPPTRTASPPSSRMGPTLPPKISALPPSHPPTLAPIASPPAPPTAPVTSPATSIIPPASIANPPDLNPPPPSALGNGAASNSVGCRGYLAALLLVVAVTYIV